MSKKRFSWKTEKLQHLDDEVVMVVDNENKEWKGHILNIVDLLNEHQEKIEDLEECNHGLGQDIIQSDGKRLELMKENEQLRKQMQNYEKLIANSYVGEEERLDGFFGKYVIWEDELQKYRQKNKNEMIDNEQETSCK